MNHRDSASVGAPCAVIIVTHNSQKHLPLCLKALKEQTRLPLQVIVVDSGSHDPSYLEVWENDPLVTLHREASNVGFCQGNNLGMARVDATVHYVLFLNPDAFLTTSFIEKACAVMEEEANSKVGALSGILLGYAMENHQPSGRIDSTGIFRTWYGRWYDRGQGDDVVSSRKIYKHREEVPALCGALMFCRLEALQKTALAPNVVMDPEFFMYKEDIDLSLRLRRQGWSLLFVPELEVYHCRGWGQDRKQVPQRLRLLSAKNEMRLYGRMRSPCYIYSALKYFMVKVCDW